MYDVFQKISKGDFQPLPPNMFSAPLRGLVARMLSVDPHKRPELEEVWSITQGVVQSQVCMRLHVWGGPGIRIHANDSDLSLVKDAFTL